MSAPHHDHDHADIPPPVVEQVSEGVFAYVQLDGSWGLNNAGFLVGSDGVTVVDTCFTERRTRALVEAIGGVTPQPLRTLVNTHHHGDHTHGNWLLPDATVIGHELCREAVLEAGTIASGLFQGVEWGDIRTRAPFVTFADRLTIHVDDLRCELHFVGPAHTTNDVVMWLPERRLLFAGDTAFNGGTPFVLMGSVQGSLDALARLQALGAETVVPGHGSVTGPSVLDDQVAYLSSVQALAADGHAAGASPLEVAQEADLGRFAEWHDSERLAGNLHRAYAELDGHPLGSEIDLMAAFGDMLTLNGGQPLRCLA